MWTNNNCESLNHVLKFCLGWKKNPLTQLVQKLREILFQQESDVESYTRHGKFYLAPGMKHYAVEPHVWASLHPGQKRKRFEEFTRNKRGLKNSHVKQPEIMRITVVYK